MIILLGQCLDSQMCLDMQLSSSVVKFHPTIFHKNEDQLWSTVLYAIDRFKRSLIAHSIANMSLDKYAFR